MDNETIFYIGVGACVFLILYPVFYFGASLMVFRADLKYERKHNTRL